MSLFICAEVSLSVSSYMAVLMVQVEPLPKTELPLVRLKSFPSIIDDENVGKNECTALV